VIQVVDQILWARDDVAAPAESMSS
jgi:hypothetical protein